jgi:hypothetical protein
LAVSFFWSIIMGGYYDIDSFLAEEELIPCTTNFDFSYLAHLDPDRRGTEMMISRTTSSSTAKANVLPENTRLKLPFWEISKWIELGYCKMNLPRHYSLRARERYMADPHETDLRRRNPQFYRSAKIILDIVQSAAKKQRKRNSSSNRHWMQLEALREECHTSLRETVLSLYRGPRMAQSLNTALSSAGEDVTEELAKLDALEVQLYTRGAKAAANHALWKQYRQRRRCINTTRPNNPTTSSNSTATGTVPTYTRNDSETRLTKRQKVQ